MATLSIRMRDDLERQASNPFLELLELAKLAHGLHLMVLETTRSRWSSAWPSG